jgi:hypothetical protein
VSRMYFSYLRMAGDVNLRHAMRGDGIDVVDGVEFVVHRGDVDVVHVEQNSAIGALDDFGQELPLGHLGGGEFGVAELTFSTQRESREVLHLRTRSAVRSTASQV